MTHNLEQVHSLTGADTVKTPDQDLLYFREGGCDARGYQTSEGLLVLAGSTGRRDLRPLAPPWVKRLRDALQEQRVVEVKDGQLVLVTAHLFSSPSAAGGLLVGGTNNGPIRPAKEVPHSKNLDGRSIGIRSNMGRGRRKGGDNQT